MRRLITLVSHPDNAPVIRAELRAVDGQYGQYGAQKPCIPNVPCPYTASLLGSAWTTDLEAGQEMYTSGVTLEQALLPAWMGCWDGDNNDGISILDVTEPDRPAYCFLRSEGVLNAHGYLNAYYQIEYKASLPERSGNEGPRDEDIDDDTEGDTDDEGEYRYRRDDKAHKRRLLQAVQALHGIPIILADVLRGAWPKVRFRDASSTATRLIWLPGKAGEIKKVLRDLNPFPDSGTQLLSRALSELKEGARVDLSGFQFSGTQLVEILSAYGEIVFLDISFNNALVADDIPKVLEVRPTIRRLVAMGCCSVLDERMLALVQNEPSRFKSLEGLLHPAFLTIEKPDLYPTAFTFVNVRDSGNLACASMPFFTPAQVVQALIDVLPWRDAKSNRDVMDASLPLVGCSAFHGAARAPGETFAQRAVVSVPFLSPRLPRDQKDFWVFVASRPSKFSFGMMKPVWGLVHFTRSEDELPATPLASPAPAPDNDGATQRRSPARPLGCSGRLYDLKGFLECMKSEGRPMPSDAAVKELERILYKKHRKTGELYCPLMTEEDAQEIEPTGSDRLFGERYDDMGFRL
ncbi:hypothetical protein V8D89_013678 [Ganoderma adspersum]